MKRHSDASRRGPRPGKFARVPGIRYGDLGGKAKGMWMGKTKTAAPAAGDAGER